MFTDGFSLIITTNSNIVFQTIIFENRNFQTLFIGLRDKWDFLGYYLFQSNYCFFRLKIWVTYGC